MSTSSSSSTCIRRGKKAKKGKKRRKIKTKLDRKKKGGKTKSQKSAARGQKKRAKELRQIQDEMGMSGMRLMKGWNCDSSRCPNVGHLYWQPFSDDGRHYKLFNEYISRWNAAISTGEADVEFPPTSLTESLYLKDKLKGVNGREKKRYWNSSTSYIQQISLHLQNYQLPIPST